MNQLSLGTGVALLLENALVEHNRAQDIYMLMIATVLLINQWAQCYRATTHRDTTVSHTLSQL